MRHLPFIAALSPFLLLCACADDDKEDDTECGGEATISGVLLSPTGEPVSQEIEFIPADEDEEDDAEHEEGVESGRRARSESFTLTPESDGTFEVEVEPGEWWVEGNWQGEPPEGDGCDLWGEVFAEYCGEHELTLEFECYWLD